MLFSTRALLLFFLLLPLHKGAWADVCASASYNLTTQSEVDDLGASGCDTVTGDLSVLDSTEIYNLEALAVIDDIQGVVTISRNTALLNLDGLVNVANAGAIVVEGNEIMTNVDGLGGLRQVGDLTISTNPELRDIEGLASLMTVSGSLTIESNPLIQNLTGLESLTRIAGALSIEDNDALQDIDSLSNLKLVGTAITIKGNDALTSIEGLSNLTARTAVTVTGEASGGGSITPASQQVLPGSSAQFFISADAGFYISKIEGNCPPGVLEGETYVTGEITSDCAVKVTFTVVPTFLVTASAGEGGSITPTSLSVEEGKTGVFTITANEGFSVGSIGGSCPRGRLSATTYTTGAINADCSVNVSFPAANASGYCSDTPEGVICDPDADGRVNPGGTMDSWRDQSWGFENSPIPFGKVVALPFTADADVIDGNGVMEFTNNMPGLGGDGYHWKGWFSESPGGPVLNDNYPFCYLYSPNPNPQSMRWSQSSNPSAYACDLGKFERVLYFNITVGCFEEILAAVPEGERTCEIDEPFPGFENYPAYYIKMYPR